ncbi:MAG: right-handed parallel beta-helix repeat-containing protein [Chloroflexota bacterium]|nr:right-handed parallel beta-helix repeat-containing protein [Chloroflexota bacterium]
MIGGIFDALARPNRITFGLPLFAPLCALLLLAQLPSALGMVVTLRVPEDYESIAAAIADAPEDAVIEIAAGAYREALVIGRPLTLRALERAQVTLVAPSDDRSVVAIRDTDAVSIEGLTIVGGEYGIFVTNSRAIKIQGNTVLGSRLAGIKVRLGAADILNNSVINAQAPYGFGIHVTNTMQWPESRVTGNIVFGNAHGGIYTNMTSMIHINDNIVRQNGEYGIAVTEMSHADVLGNTVAGTTGIGINVLDMSMALVCDNLVIDTVSDIDSQSIRNGNGITVDYHSEAFLSGNTIAGSALNGLSVLYGSYAYLHGNQISDSMEQSVYVDDSVVEEGAGCEADH